MSNGSGESGNTTSTWRLVEILVMGVVCLVVGLTVGYLIRGSAVSPTVAAEMRAPNMGPPTRQQMPSLEQMKQMADKKAEPLLLRLNSEPSNAQLLVQIGDIYKATHQFRDAAEYYGKALKIDPSDVGVRTDMASCFYYLGESDRSVAELKESLKHDPKHAGTWFNLGVIEWKGRADADASIAAFQQLLKLYPNYERREIAEKLMAEARAHKATGAEPKQPAAGVRN